MSINSLSTLLGQYGSSDSENEDEQNDDIAGQVNSLFDEIKQSEKVEYPITYWTQCMDPATGHPYYWNTETKEVTWEIPAEYDAFLKNMSPLQQNISKSCWKVAYNEETKAPYYVNQYTRVVCWEKPEGCSDVEFGPYVDPDVSTSKNDPIKTTRTITSFTENLTDRTVESIHAPPSTNVEEETRICNEKQQSISTSKLIPYVTVGDSELDITKEKTTTNSNGESHDDDIDCSNNIKSNTIKSLSPTAPKVETFASIITGGKTNDPMDEDLTRLKSELETLESSASEISKTITRSEPSTMPSFDEKTFQRKRRIEFKTNPIVTQTTNLDYHPGLGYNNNSNPTVNTKEITYINFKKSHVEFNDGSIGDSKSSESDTQNKPETQLARTEIDDYCDLISSKIQFLLVGKADISAVQTMYIQFETLIAAYRSTSLDAEYFFKWLKATSDNLKSLEESAAPDGWECFWDRPNSQYCYKNITTGEIQWKFPEENNEQDETSKQHGEDEMDISTTPPPNESEQLTNDPDSSAVYDLDNPPPPPRISDEVSSPPAYLQDSREKPQTADICGELASFYSDLATLEVVTPNSPNPSSNKKDKVKESATNTDATTKILKRVEGENKIRKKQKKAKIQGLGSKMKEVSSMVANWQKARKELDSK